VTQPPPESDFDFLFGGEEINTTVEQAAVRDASELEAEHGPTRAVHFAGAAQETQVVSPADDDADPGEGFPPAAPPVPAGPPLPDPTADFGPLVAASACPSGHPNPPDARACRYCGQPIAPAPPVQLPRPVLGMLRFSTGAFVPLIGPLVIGRSPTADAEGGHPDRELVRIASPGARISRSHLAVAIDGWDVLVTDLHTGNGTTLVTPGQGPRHLEPGETVALPVGSTIWLAKEVSFAYTVA
jgi:hypothetical protein